MTSDGTRIQILANWPMSHAKRVTRDNRKNPEYHVDVAIRKLRTDTNCPAGKSWPNHVKKMSSIWDLKRPTAPKNTGQYVQKILKPVRVSRASVPFDQRSENESSESNHFEITKKSTEFCLKWLLPELSFSDRWSRGTKTLETRLTETGIRSQEK